MKAFLIAEYIVNTLLLIWRHMHMFQLNSYFFKKNMLWIGKNKLQVICQLFFIILSTMLAYMNSTGATIVAIVIMIVSIIYNMPKGKSKTPLKLTGRVKRMFVTEIAIIAIIVCICGIKNYVGIKFPVINMLAIFLCMIANAINYPVEALARLWYINDAKKILKSCPNLIVIGVTGSYGKTSVKNFLAKTLSTKYDVLVTPQNYNTTMGVVKTIREHLKSTHQVFVCEMGATKPNDIKEICDLVHPKYGVITSVGPQHLESFKSIENVIKTKFELADSVKDSGGIVFLNYNNEYIRNKKIDMNVVTYGIEDDLLDYNAFNIHSSGKGVTFKVKDEDGEIVEFTTTAIGRYNIANIMAAIAVANKLGVPVRFMIPRVREIKNVEHRLQLINRGNINIIDDSYNSNPVSSKLSIETLGEFEGVKIIVTPGLIELGDKQKEYNYELGVNISAVCDYVFLVGKDNSKEIMEGIKSKKFDESKIFFVSSPQEAMQEILKLNIQGKVTVLLENDLPDNYR